MAALGKWDRKAPERESHDSLAVCLDMGQEHLGHQHDVLGTTQPSFLFLLTDSEPQSEQVFGSCRTTAALPPPQNEAWKCCGLPSCPFLTDSHPLLSPVLCPLHSCKWPVYLSAAFNAHAQCPFQPRLLQGQQVFSPLFPLLKPQKVHHITTVLKVIYKQNIVPVLQMAKLRFECQGET